MDLLPDKNSSYKDVAYWDERYTREQQYDWLGEFSKFQHLLEKVMKKEDSILILGTASDRLNVRLNISFMRCFARGYDVEDKVCSGYGRDFDIKYNSKKSSIMIVRSREDSELMFPDFSLSGNRLDVSDECCGNSSMSGDMYGAGYRSITNIDYSSVCISAMSAKYSRCPGMTWHQMDVRQLSFPDASFDVILEKATLDAIMVEEKTPWEVSPETTCFVHQALTEISRCLKPGGRFVSITFAQPFFRKRLYARSVYDWSIKQHSYGEGFQYFLFVMTKGEELSPEDAALEKKLLEEPKPSSANAATTQNEDQEDFLFNTGL